MEETTPAAPPSANQQTPPQTPAPADPQMAAGEADDQGLTSLHPNHLSATRVEASLISIPFIVGALVLEGSGVLPPAMIILPVVLIALWLIIYWVLRRHNARGYALSDDRLRVVRGLLIRHDTVVPIGRVQHIDVNQGPIERFFGIATLTLHTAGTHNSSVDLPGLGEQLARDMREQIRNRIKREAL